MVYFDIPYGYYLLSPAGDGEPTLTEFTTEPVACEACIPTQESKPIQGGLNS